MSSLVFPHLSSHCWSNLLPRYELVPLRASVGYVQAISNDVAQASPRLVPPLISCVCHRSRYDLFFYAHKSIVTCASQLRLVVGHVTFYRPTFCSIQHGQSDHNPIEFAFLGSVGPQGHTRHQKLGHFNQLTLISLCNTIIATVP
jgi:hypothetical protein